MASDPPYSESTSYPEIGMYEAPGAVYPRGTRTPREFTHAIDQRARARYCASRLVRGNVFPGEVTQ